MARWFPSWAWVGLGQGMEAKCSASGSSRSRRWGRSMTRMLAPASRRPTLTRRPLRGAPGLEGGGEDGLGVVGPLATSAGAQPHKETGAVVDDLVDRHRLPA